MEQRKRISSEQRREQILNAACELFARQGFGSTTTRQLAEKVGCSETIIFRIFPSKEAIFEELFDEWSQADIRPEVLEIVDGSALKTLQKFCEKLLRYDRPIRAGQLVRTGWRREDLGQAAACRNGEEKWQKAYSEVLQKSNDVVRVTLAPVIRLGQQNGEIRPGDPEKLAQMLWCMISGINSIKHLYPERFIELQFEDFASMLTSVYDRE